MNNYERIKTAGIPLKELCSSYDLTYTSVRSWAARNPKDGSEKDILLGLLLEKERGYFPLISQKKIVDEFKLYNKENPNSFSEIHNTICYHPEMKNPNKGFIFISGKSNHFPFSVKIGIDHIIECFTISVFDYWGFKYYEISSFPTLQPSLDLREKIDFNPIYQIVKKVAGYTSSLKPSIDDLFSLPSFRVEEKVSRKRTVTKHPKF